MCFIAQGQGCRFWMDLCGGWCSCWECSRKDPSTTIWFICQKHAWWYYFVTCPLLVFAEDINSFVWSIPWVLRLMKITTRAKYAFCVHMICIIYVAAWVLFKSLHYLVILYDSKPYESKWSTFCKASLVWRRAVRLWYQYSLSWPFRGYFQVLKEPHRVTIKRIIAQRTCQVQAEVWKGELLKKKVDDLEDFANTYVGKTRWKFQLGNHTDCIGLCAEVV